MCLCLVPRWHRVRCDVGIGVTCKQQQETPEGTLQDGEPPHERGPKTHEREHTKKAPNSRRQQETPNAHAGGGNEYSNTHGTQQP